MTNDHRRYTRPLLFIFQPGFRKKSSCCWWLMLFSLLPVACQHTHQKKNSGKITSLASGNTPSSGIATYLYRGSCQCQQQLSATGSSIAWIGALAHPGVYLCIYS